MLSISIKRVLFKHLFRKQVLWKQNVLLWRCFALMWGLFLAPSRTAASLWPKTCNSVGQCILKNIALLWKFVFGMNSARLYPTNKQRGVQCFTYLLDEFTVFFYALSGIWESSIIWGIKVSNLHNCSKRAKYSDCVPLFWGDEKQNAKHRHLRYLIHIWEMSKLVFFMTETE